MDIKDLENFIQKDHNLVGDLVIIKIEDVAMDEDGEQNWRWFSSYVWDKEKQKGWAKGISDSIELKGCISSDIKPNNLIYYWNPFGKVLVSGNSDLVIESVEKPVADLVIVKNQISDLLKTKKYPNSSLCKIYDELFGITLALKELTSTSDNFGFFTKNFDSDDVIVMKKKILELTELVKTLTSASNNSH